MSNIFKHCLDVYLCKLGIQCGNLRRDQSRIHRYAFSTSVGASFDTMRALRSKMLRPVSSGSYAAPAPTVVRFSCHFHWNSMREEREEAAGGAKEAWTTTACPTSGFEACRRYCEFTTRHAISRRTGARFHACTTKAREGERKRRVSPRCDATPKRWRKIIKTFGGEREVGGGRLARTLIFRVRKPPLSWEPVNWCARKIWIEIKEHVARRGFNLLDYIFYKC